MNPGATLNPGAGFVSGRSSAVGWDLASPGARKCRFNHPALLVKNGRIGVLGMGGEIGQLHLGFFLQPFGIGVCVGRTPLSVKPIPLAGRLGFQR